MKSIGLWAIRTLGAVLLLSVVAGCFVGGWHRDYRDNNSEMRDGDRGLQGDWGSDRKTNQDRDGRFVAEQNLQQYSQEHSGDTH